MLLLIAALLLLVGGALAVTAWPPLVAEWLRRASPPPPSDVFGRPERPPSLTRVEAVGAGVEDACAPTPYTEGQRTQREEFMDFLDAVDQSDRDDPSAWPDPAAAADTLAAARAALFAGEAAAERAAWTGLGGPAADEALRGALPLLRRARAQGAARGDVCAGFAAAVWTRCRAVDQRHFRDGVMQVVRWANAGLAAEPGNLPSKVMAVRAQVALGALDSARHALIELMSAHPEHSEVLRTRSRWLRAHGDRRGAAEAMLPLLPGLSPSLQRAERSRIAPWLLKERQFADAHATYRALVAEAPADPESQMGLAQSALELKRFDEAEGAARSAVQHGGGEKARSVLRDVMGRAGRAGP